MERVSLVLRERLFCSAQPSFLTFLFFFPPCSDVPAGSAATGSENFTAFTAVSQSSVTGAGTVASPFQIVTTVALPDTNLQVVETDSYVLGQEVYRTDIVVKNSGSSPAQVIVYKAGDCFLQDSDSGFGAYDAATGTISCQASTPDGVRAPRKQSWIPLTPGSNYFEDTYSTIWAGIGSLQPFPNTCRCSDSSSDLIDNGAGLSWTLQVPANGQVSVGSLSQISPLGVSPITASKSVDAASVIGGSNIGFTIALSNPALQQAPQIITGFSDEMPIGFSYVAGSTTGATTSDPAINGQTLTWSVSASVAPGATSSIHFSLTAPNVNGTFTNFGSGAAQAGVPIARANATIQVIPFTTTTPAITTTTPAATTTSAAATTTTSTAAATTTTTTLAATVSTTTLSAAPATTTTSTAAATTSTTTVPLSTTIAQTTSTLAVTTTSTVAATTTRTTTLSSTTSPAAVAASDLVVVKDDCASTVRVGVSYTFSVTVSNLGPSAASGVVLTDNWPSSYTLQSVSSNCVVSSSVITCSWAQVASGATVSANFGYQVNVGIAPGSRVTNCAHVSSATTELNLVNNDDCDTNVVSPCATYNGACSAGSDCCAPLQCLRHVSACNGTAAVAFRCASRGGSSLA
jgi:uncharacterized repeat protein (TIGR01451 family)